MHWKLFSFIALAMAAMTVSSPAQAGEVVVKNESSWAIYYFYMSSTSQSEWGEDHLGSDTISTGAEHTLRKIACDSYDIKIIDEDGDECKLMNIRMGCGDSTTWAITSDMLLSCQSATASGGSGEVGGNINVVNNSNWAIHYLHMSPTSDSNWGPDKLGSSSVIAANGGRFTLSNVACDNYDIKVIDEDQDVCVMNNIRMCGSNDWTITSDALLSCQGNSQ